MHLNGGGDGNAATCRFDGVGVVPEQRYEGFQIRDVVADSDFMRIDTQALGVRLKCRRSTAGRATFFDIALSTARRKDRAVTLVYTVPVDAGGLNWLENPRTSEKVNRGREYMNAALFEEDVVETTVMATPGREFRRSSRRKKKTSVAANRMAGVGANGRISRYPFGAVASCDQGLALGIDMAHPAFYRVGYNSASEELFIAFDIGLVPEKPVTRFRFCRFEFDPSLGFRGALSRFYDIFPDQFRCRATEQGLWMPFSSIRALEGWRDFGFKFKEGHGEHAWEKAHGITTFRYSEPFTWWMPIPSNMPHTKESAVKVAAGRARQGDIMAMAALTSASYNENGKPDVKVCNPAWCRRGAVWSLNSMPGIEGKVTDFNVKWNRRLRDELYRPTKGTPIGGEYIDSSEGYITAILDFRRDHFSCADTPLTFSLGSRKPAIFSGLAAFEYVRRIARDVHRLGGLMMANSTPGRVPWLMPFLDVAGAEINWSHRGRWRAPSDADMLYRRAMSKGKPYCFLMNTGFDRFTHDMAEKYMKRCLAYGMFPGFFSHNAMEDAYFGRPDLYNRDRCLFRKYVPLCKLVGEAGWEPVTVAATDRDSAYVERFGDRYLTVLNDCSRAQKVTVSLNGLLHRNSRELVRGGSVRWEDGATELLLDPGDVAVVKLR